MGKLIQYRTGASLYDGAFDSTVGWSAAGMGYIIVSDGGRLAVIDGGFDNDAEALLSLLEAQTEGRKPRIDLWIITHPHIDHYGALRAISNDPDLLRRLGIKQIIYQFPMEFVGKDGAPVHWRIQSKNWRRFAPQPMLSRTAPQETKRSLSMRQRSIFSTYPTIAPF